MTTPVPGFVAPAPRTWSKGDFMTAARWRGDMTNLGYLYAGGARPMLLSQNTSGTALATSSNELINLGAQVPLNTWNVPITAGTTTAATPYFQIPMTGWYLLQCDATVNLAGTPQNFKYGVGFDIVSNGSHSQTDAGSYPAVNSTQFLNGFDGCELYRFNTFADTADTAAVYLFTNNSSPGSAHTVEFMAEWVGLPVAGSVLAGPYGTVVPEPQPAAQWASGQGTYLFSSGTAGATSIVVNDNTGMIVGGTLGLDYINSQQFANEAEVVTITSVSGTGIGITATSYPHAQFAPVAVPWSAAFLNQQVRDVVNFLAYPPMVRAVTNQAQSLPSQTFPAGTQITNLAVTLGSDTFSGFASNTYTAQVAGIYLVYGQVYYAGSTSAFDAAAGIAQNGSISWGTRFRSTSSSARTVCATVRRHLRLNEGDTITLYGSQDSGSAMNTTASGTAFSKLIVLWRAF